MLESCSLDADSPKPRTNQSFWADMPRVATNGSDTPKLLALEEEMVRAEEDLEALETSAFGISCLGGDMGDSPQKDGGKQSIGGNSGGGGGGGGCAALPNAAMNAESKTYSQVHRVLDPIIDFTTSQCGCDPIAFAAGTGGRYDPQNSVVDEGEYVDDRAPSSQRHHILRMETQ